MSHEDYQQLENNVPKRTEVSPEAYEQAIENETQKLPIKIINQLIHHKESLHQTLKITKWNNKIYQILDNRIMLKF